MFHILKFFHIKILKKAFLYNLEFQHITVQEVPGEDSS